MFTLKSEPQDKVSVLKQSFALYKYGFSCSLPYALLATCFIFLPQLMFTQTSVQMHTVVWAFAGATLISTLFLTALLFRLYCLCYQVPSSFSQSMRHSFFKLIPLVLLGVLYSIIVAGSSMLLIVPGIIFAYALCFAFILLITGHQTVLQTLISSFKITQYYWWRTFFVINIPVLLMLSASLAIFLAVSWCTLYFGFNHEHLFGTLYVTNVLVQACLIPLLFSTTLVLLHDLRQRHFVKQPSW